MLRSTNLLFALGMALFVALSASKTPDPAAVDPDPAAFQTAAAFRTVQTIAARPHPTGSKEHDRVRDHLVASLRGLGLETRVQRGRAMEVSDDPEDGKFFYGADLQNLIGVLPGRDRTAPPLVVMSHYDTAPSSPGAADDSTGVAVALEVARALKAGPRPHRDVVFLITDGEEIGLLGARAFFRDDPLAKRVGMVINMESRGGGGRVYMFQTSEQNGELIRLFRKAAVNPTSTSLATYLYNQMPNDTDFTVSKAAGKPGLNFAFIGSQFDYHAATSTPANLNKGSLTHMGEQVLAATRALADVQALPRPAPDLVYADVLGGPIIAYPPVVGWLLLIAAAGLIGLAAHRARRATGWRWMEAVQGAAAALYATLGSGAAFVALRAASGSPQGFTDQRPLLARFVEFEAGLGLLALAMFLLAAWGLRSGNAWRALALLATAMGVLAQAQGLDPIGLGLGLAAAAAAFVAFRRPAGGWGPWLGMLAVGLALGLVLQALAPPTALVAAWPLLGAALAATVTAFTGGGRLDGGWAIAAAMVVGILFGAQILYTAHPVVLGVGALLPAAPAIFVLLLALVLFPLNYTEGPRTLLIVGIAALVGAAALLAIVRFADASDARRPHVTQVLYVADAETGKAWRATGLRRPDAWTRAVLEADGGRVAKAEFAPVTRWGHAATARPVPVQRPPLTVSRSADGLVSIRLGPVASARELRLRLETSAAIADPRINGLPAPGLARDGKPGTAIWAAPAEGLTVTFRSPPNTAKVRYAVLSDGWPAGARPLPRRPDDAMPWGQTDLLAVIGDRSLSW